VKPAIAFRFNKEKKSLSNDEKLGEAHPVNESLLRIATIAMN
jgi:hypothetical protein